MAPGHVVCMLGFSSPDAGAPDSFLRVALPAHSSYTEFGLQGSIALGPRCHDGGVHFTRVPEANPLPGSNLELV